MQAFASSPDLISCWLAGYISSGYLKGASRRWYFGTFTILVPAISLPLFGILVYYYYKAKKQGIVPKRESQRTVWQSLLYYCREFDAVGPILLSAGVAMFLLPFNLHTLQAKGWRFPPNHMPAGLRHSSYDYLRHMGEVLRPCHIYSLFSPPRLHGLWRLYPFCHAVH